MITSEAIVPIDASAGTRPYRSVLQGSSEERRLTLTAKPKKPLQRAIPSRQLSQRDLAAHSSRTAQLTLQILLVDPETIIDNPNRP